MPPVKIPATAAAPTHTKVEFDVVRLATGDWPFVTHSYTVSGVMPVQENTPPSDVLDAQVLGPTVPAYWKLTSTSSCASVRSSAVGAMPAADSPPENVAVMDDRDASHEAVLVMVVLMQDVKEVALDTAEPDCQPPETKPAGQSVHVDVPSAHEPAVRVA